MSSVIVSVVFIYCYAECRHADCRYAECRGAIEAAIGVLLA
jgi:hypothetical protein